MEENWGRSEGFSSIYLVMHNVLDLSASLCIVKSQDITTTSFKRASPACGFYGLVSDDLKIISYVGNIDGSLNNMPIQQVKYCMDEEQNF